jgi:hypothetical protein
MQFRCIFSGLCKSSGRYLFCGLLVLMLSMQSLAEDVVQEIKIPAVQGSYFHRLLDLAFSKTKAEYGDYQFRFGSEELSGKRALLATEKGRLDVVWRHYQEVKEYQVTPIKIRILKHLSDYRLLLIRQDDQERFNHVQSLADLRALKGGIGSHWPDRDIMERNKLTLIMHVNYHNLFKMLLAKRFDYYSRGAFQVLPDIKKYESAGIKLEQRLLLHYDNPLYFYVAKNNTQLASRIEKGLNMAIDDGSFDELFYQIEAYRWADQFLQTHNRLVIELK